MRGLWSAAASPTVSRRVQGPAVSFYPWASEITKAADALRAEGVVSPERMIAMLLPGFGV
jgi:hypothetical protein